MGKTMRNLENKNYERRGNAEYFYIPTEGYKQPCKTVGKKGNSRGILHTLLNSSPVHWTVYLLLKAEPERHRTLN